MLSERTGEEGVICLTAVSHQRKLRSLLLLHCGALISHVCTVFITADSYSVKLNY